MATPKKKKRFEYNLETVLKVRVIHEKQQQEKFSLAERKLIEEKAKEEEMKRQEAKKYLELRDQMAPGSTLDFAKILLQKTDIEKFKKEVETQEEVRKVAEEKKEEERQLLVERLREKKVIEKHRAKQNTEWKSLMRKEETKFLDDISTIRFNRKRRDSSS